MAAPAKPAINPIALKQGEGEALWFFGSLAILKASTETTAGRVTVIEQVARQGNGPPLHVHHREDEWFYILEGELTFWVGGKIVKAPAGSFVYGPRDIPQHLHRHVATSAQPCGHRACRVRKVHAHIGRTGGGTHDSAGERSAAEPRPNHGSRGRVRARNTGPARHPFVAEPGRPRRRWQSNSAPVPLYFFDWRQRFQKGLFTSQAVASDGCGKPYLASVPDR